MNIDFTLILSWVFVILIGFAILMLAYSLYRYLQKLKERNDFNVLILSFFLGLMVSIGIDLMLGGDNLFKLLINLIDSSKVSFFPLSLSIVIFTAIMLGYLITNFTIKNINLKNNYIIFHRYMIVVFTMILFFLIRSYVYSISISSVQGLFPILGFIIGVSLRVVFSTDLQISRLDFSKNNEKINIEKVKTIKGLIAEGKLDKAIDLTIDYVQETGNNEIENEIVLLKSQIKDLRKKVLINSIDEHYGRRELSKLTLNLLDLVDSNFIMK